MYSCYLFLISASASCILKTNYLCQTFSAAFVIIIENEGLESHLTVSGLHVIYVAHGMSIKDLFLAKLTGASKSFLAEF